MIDLRDYDLPGIHFDATLGGKYPAHHPWTDEQKIAYTGYVQEVLRDAIKKAWPEGFAPEVAARLSIEYPLFASTIYGALETMRYYNTWDIPDPRPEAFAESERRAIEWLDKEGYPMLAARYPNGL